MVDAKPILIAAVLGIAAILHLWRPRGWVSVCSASLLACVFLLAVFSPYNGFDDTVRSAFGPAVTIVSIIVMSSVLESIGIFRFAAENLIAFSRGSGLRLYWYVIGFCFLMTMFFSVYVSIIVTTPIILQIVRMLELSDEQQKPFLISGAIIATVAGAPIGASNLANLTALEMMDQDLNRYSELMFIPSLIAVLTIAGLLYVMYRRRLPERISDRSQLSETNIQNLTHADWRLFRVCILIVVTVRAGFFIGAGYEVPTWWIGLTGSLMLIVVRWLGTGLAVRDIAAKTPWHIPLFAFSAYEIAAELQQTGIFRFITRELAHAAAYSDLAAAMGAGILLTAISGIVTQLPSLLLGTLWLTGISSDTDTLHLIFSAQMMGANIGALITPVGALSTLLWMMLLRRYQVKLSWSAYMKTAAVTIPAGLLIGLFSLYAWTQIIG
jgi:arsenical pump membrane protein